MTLEPTVAEGAREVVALLRSGTTQAPDGMTVFADTTALVAAARRKENAFAAVVVGTVANHASTCSDDASAIADTLHLVQDLLDTPELHGTVLCFAVPHALATPARPGPCPVAAAVWSLVATAQRTHPGRIVLMDAPPEDWTSFLDAYNRTGAAQLVRSAEEVLEPVLQARQNDADELVLPSGAWRVRPSDRATIDDLEPSEDVAFSDPLPSGMVRIAVRVMGLSLRDLLVTLGEHPESKELGSEASGVVLDIAEDVQHLAPGDRVMGLVTDAASSLTVTAADRLIRMPEGWTFAQGAAVPVAYLTATAALRDHLHVRPGQTVLVQARDVGVKLATVAMARRLGAQAIAVTGIQDRDAVTNLGGTALDLHAIGASTLEDAVLKLTGGKGVDIAIHTAGTFGQSALQCVADGGNTVALGGAATDDTIGSTRADLTRHVVDARLGSTALIRARLQEIVAEIDSEQLPRVPTTVAPFAKLRGALHAMQRCEYGHKVVLEMPHVPGPAGTTVLTGGFGTAETALAGHLIACYGVRDLVLVGRGEVDDSVKAEVELKLLALGARKVSLRACDIDDADAVAALMAELRRDSSVTCVVHWADRTCDAGLDGSDSKNLWRTFGPGAGGVVNLHNSNQTDDTWCFVSMSCVSAAAGETEDALSNATAAYVEAVMCRRSAQGLHATSLAWGEWATPDAAVGTSVGGNGSRLDRLGIAALSITEGLDLVDRALSVTDPWVAPLRIDLNAMRKARTSGLLPRCLSPVLHRPDERSGRRPKVAGQQALSSWAALRTAVQEHLRMVLGLSEQDALFTEQAFRDMGINSLTLVELRNRLQFQTGLTIPIRVLTENDTIEGLTNALWQSVETDALVPVNREVSERGITDILEEAVARNKAVEGFGLLAAAAATRETFSADQVQEPRSGFVSVAHGAAKPRLVCVNSFGPTVGEFSYARFARHFQAERDVDVLLLPGFVEGEALPSDISAAVVALSWQAGRIVGDDPFILAGYSSGGWICGALAAHMESVGRAPLGAVMIDSPPPAELSRTGLTSIGTGLFEIWGEYISRTFAPMSAYGWYMALFRDWSPPKMQTRIFAVDADEGMPYTDILEWSHTWPTTCGTIRTPGNHFTIMTEHSKDVADGIRSWIESEWAGQ